MRRTTARLTTTVALLASALVCFSTFATPASAKYSCGHISARGAGSVRVVALHGKVRCRNARKVLRGLYAGKGRRHQGPCRCNADAYIALDGWKCGPIEQGNAGCRRGNRRIAGWSSYAYQQPMAQTSSHGCSKQVILASGAGYTGIRVSGMSCRSAYRVLHAYNSRYDRHPYRYRIRW